MIALPKISISDTDTATSGLSAKSSDGAQDFLALLAGALGEDENPTLLARLQDLQAGHQTTGEKATALTALLEKETSKTQIDLTDVSDVQNLLQGMIASRKSDLPAVTPSEGDLQEDDLADLSALMAMLPVQQAPQAATPARTTAEDTASVSSLASGIPLKNSAVTNELPVATKGAAAEQLHGRANDVAFPAPAIAADTPAAVRVETESTPSPAAPSAVASPIISTSFTPAPAHAAAIATVSSPLGSQDWQQNVSQHITLFTRQGQQTAELRLHPEDLGQVQITLKMDDNQAQLQMVSPHSHVRAALEAALPTLRTQLAESGIQLGQSSISSESFAGQQQSSSQEQSARQSSSGERFAAQDEELLPVPASLQSRVSGNRAVDIFA